MDYKDDDDKDGKHICAICGDTVTNTDYKTPDLTSTCRDYKNRESYHKCSDLCQYCRYQKALAMGTKREAAQEEVGSHHQHHHGGSMGMSGSGTGY
nr:artificial RNA-ligase [synthetic construct]